MITDDQVNEFYRLFRGNEAAYGVFTPEENREDGKLEGKASTERKPVHQSLVKRHLEGPPNPGLGIVPINHEHRCKWACIDVDIYPVDYKAILLGISENDLSLCVFKSKSGGAHVIQFTKEFVPAKNAIASLKAQAAKLGLSAKEFFPKQEELYPGAVGNWLNMPYYGNTRACVVLQKGGKIKELTFTEFLEYVKDRELARLPKVALEKRPLRFPNGPPCLDRVLAKGPVEKHSRNNFLMHLGVYLKRANPSDWQAQLRQMNSDGKTIAYPFYEDVEGLIKRLEKENYDYQCHEQPVCHFCNEDECKTRQFGIASGTCIITKATNYVWGTQTFVVISVISKGKTYDIELTPEELSNYRKIVPICIRQIQDFPPPPKSDLAWLRQMGELLKNAATIYKQTAQDDILEQFRDYCNKNRTQGDIKDHLLVNDELVWFDHKNKLIWFKLKGIAKATGIKHYELQQLIVRLEGKSAQQLFFANQHVNRRFDCIPMDVIFEDLPNLEVPEKAGENEI